LIKWIRCAVSGAAEFDQGQRGWQRLAGEPGFLAQFGGWSRHDRNVAHVFGLWSDAGSYDRFMRGRHDDLAGPQAGTYGAIQVRIFTRLFDMGRPDLTGGALLRLAHCHVRPGHVDHFEQVQRDVWLPGMTAAPGMLGGVFAAGEPAEYLVLSTWRSAADHTGYLTDRFPALRRNAATGDDLASIAGELIDMESGWTVTTVRGA
jgi:hypothetical protein